jgi:hypothetical protein
MHVSYHCCCQVVDSLVLLFSPFASMHPLCALFTCCKQPPLAIGKQHPYRSAGAVRGATSDVPLAVSTACMLFACINHSPASKTALAGYDGTCAHGLQHLSSEQKRVVTRSQPWVG